MTTIKITGSELREIAEQDIADQAAESAALHREQGWVGGGDDYDIGVYYGDREGLAERLGYEPAKEQVLELERQIRAKLDETETTMITQAQIEACVALLRARRATNGYADMPDLTAAAGLTINDTLELHDRLVSRRDVVCREGRYRLLA